MTAILIVDAEADRYARRVREAFPAVAVQTAKTSAEALGCCHDAAVVVGLAHEISDDLVGAMPGLRWVAALTTGTDHLDTLRNLKPDVIVTSGRGIHGPQMAELAFYYMIGLSRDVRGMMANQDAQRWERWPQRLLLGKTIVVVGIGAISEDLAERCRAFGMTTLGVSSARSDARGFDRVLPRDQLLAAAAEADFLVALVPYGPETHAMIGDAVFTAMKPAAFFINIARGKVVDEAALIRHLRSGSIAGAGLDVYEIEPPVPENPLWKMPNVIMTPRIGGMSDTYADQALPLLLANIESFLASRPGDMRNIVTRRNDP
jgi:D-2-hydroxyacid dehydrogenase (NADP+)